MRALLGLDEQSGYGAPLSGDTRLGAERLERVRSNIADAALRSGRAPNSVRLIAVSKGQSVDAIRAAYAAGQRDFGENYAQELVAKAQALGDLPDLRWHFIGRLQQNK